jgi:phospholipid/cholesterol/gamma-HCH transport system substrate-binding protein
VQKESPSALRLFGMAFFALSCFGLLLFLWLSFGGSIPLQAKKYQLRVSFPEATTLAEQADVRIAGVKVGKMRRKDLDRIGNRTRTLLDIDSDYAPLPKNTRAILRQKTLLGETFVELTPGDPDSGYLKDHSVLPPGQVDSTVELDEILRTFDPGTKKAFRAWVRSSGLQTRGTAPQDFNNAIGNLADFASDGADVLRVLHEQRTTLRLLVRNTGEVFAALNERKGQLRGLIVNSQRTFSALASQDDALAETFAIFPTFLDESKATAERLERFAINTHPLINDLKPVADNLGPTVQDICDLSPDLTRFFVRLKPVIRSAPRTLPHAARFLRGAKPVLAALHPFLQELNPILSYVNFDQQIVAHFISIGGAALNYRINGEPNTHMLPQLGIINSKSLSLQANENPPWVRGNAYIAPNAYDRAIPLGIIESATCENTGGTQRRPDSDDGGDDPRAPCFEQPPMLYKPQKYPVLKKGEIYREPPPNFSLRGRQPAHPFRHP